MSNIKSREQIIAEARRIKSEIEQIRTDTDHWNQSVRKPNELIIDWDPDGKMSDIIRGINTMLAAEEGRIQS